jgi:uncharacterized YigZ family protein
VSEFPDHWLTLSAECEAEIKILGSRFLGFARPIDDPAAPSSYLKTIQTKFYDATHHCYAYRLGPAGNEVRMVDDGEPSGTAGRPILTAIEKAGLTNVLVVVVRYFGGTKLGVGGLARAYGEAAAAALASGAVVERYATERITVAFDHALTSPVMRALDQAGLSVVDSRYDERAHLTVDVRVSLAADFRARLTEATRGGVTFES